MNIEIKYKSGKQLNLHTNADSQSAEQLQKLMKICKCNSAEQIQTPSNLGLPTNWLDDIKW